MQLNYKEDTIAAISTPIGQGAIGIVRLSGKQALEIAAKIFFSKNKTSPKDFQTYTLHYGWIKDKQGKVIDEVLLGLMRAPFSYTREDVVEINCHSGIVVLRKILDRVLECGARLAEPGEFTLRAFLNGRIDLTQAEAVIDIIKAKSQKALSLGLNQLKGSISKEIDKIRDALVCLLASLEAQIDFPEEDLGQTKLPSLAQELSSVAQKIKNLADTAYAGKVLRQGIMAVICGRPNVGKSSLLNALLKEERSIVTHIAGTTRDIVEETVDIKGIPVRLVDTAGISVPKNIIEHKALHKTKEYVEKADLTLFLLDASEKLKAQDYRLMKKLNPQNTILLLNKIDLKCAIEKEKICQDWPEYLEISALRRKNIDKLEERISQMVWNGHLEMDEGQISVNSRQRKLLKEAHQALLLAQKAIKENLSLEFIAEEIRSSLGFLDQILGKSFSQDTLNNIFTQFCIGK